MAQRTSPFASWKPTQKDLDFVAGSAGNNWRSLLTHLGIDLADIESFKNESLGETKDACFKGLVHWLKGNVPDEPVTFGTLFEALEDAKMTGCISKLENRLKAKSPLNRADQDLSTQTNSVSSRLSSHAVVQRVANDESRPSSSQSSMSDLAITTFSDEDAASRLGIVAALDLGLSKGTSSPQTYTDKWLAGDPPDRRLQAAFLHLQPRFARLLDKHIDEIKPFLRTRQKNEEWPYKLLEEDDIDAASDVQTIFNKIRIENCWLNTEILIRLISVLPDRKTQHKAEQLLENYHKLLEVFSKLVLVKHIPKDVARSEHFRSSLFPKLMVTYDVNIEEFDVSKLLKQKKFLARLLNISEEAFHYLEAKSTESTLVVWAMAISREKAESMFESVQHEFWSLKECSVIKVELEGVFQLDLRGKEFPRMKKALQCNQDFLACTESVSRQFLALVDYSHPKRKDTEVCPVLPPLCSLKPLGVLQMSGSLNVDVSKNREQTWPVEEGQRVPPSVVDEPRTQPSAVDDEQRTQPSAVDEQRTQPSAVDEQRTQPSAVDEQRTQPSAVDEQKTEALRELSSHHTTQSYGEPKYIAAVDFGTTFTGVAFTVKSTDFKPEDIEVKNDWKNTEQVARKVPTSVLFNKYGHVIAYGYEAEDRVSDYEVGCALFRHFKMFLHTQNMKFNRDSKLTSLDGRTWKSAFEVVSKALEYLGGLVRDFIKKKTGQLPLNIDITWVITVPAIWNFSLRQFMRNAVKQAGLCRADCSNLVIALEPECAALYLEHKYEDMRRERYAIVDCGGGTAEVSYHRCQPSGQSSYTIHELKESTGEPKGGTLADRKFEALIDEFFGSRTIEKLKKGHLSNYLDLIKDFEKLKSSINDAKAKNVTYFRFLPNAQRSIDGVSIKKEEISIEDDKFSSLFEESVDWIRNHLAESLRIRSVRGVKRLYFTGGFSQCKLLQDRVSDLGPEVIYPDEVELTVVKGAIMYANNPHIVKSRVMPMSYGSNMTLKNTKAEQLQ